MPNNINNQSWKKGKNPEFFFDSRMYHMAIEILQMKPNFNTIDYEQSTSVIKEIKFYLMPSKSIFAKPCHIAIRIK